MSLVDVQNRPSTVKVWEIRGMWSALWRFAERLVPRRADMPSLSAQWCEQYERDSAKH